MDVSARFVAKHVATLPKSGIRDFFAIVSKMKDAVSLGIGEPDKTGDKIYNGALDNASGIATLLEVAHAFSQSERPRRSNSGVPIRSSRKAMVRETEGWDLPSASAPSVRPPFSTIIASISRCSLSIFITQSNITPH